MPFEERRQRVEAATLAPPASMGQNANVAGNSLDDGTTPLRRIVRHVPAGEGDI
jgi:hypothetical protein